jgi:hypothetical protein
MAFWILTLLPQAAFVLPQIKLNCILTIHPLQRLRFRSGRNAKAEVGDAIARTTSIRRKNSSRMQVVDLTTSAK